MKDAKKRGLGKCLQIINENHQRGRAGKDYGETFDGGQTFQVDDVEDICVSQKTEN